MPETMIDRAARAMYANVGPDWSWDDPDAELLRQMYRENVRVALAAMREPSAAVADAVATAWDTGQESRTGGAAWSVFQAGIEAALIEEA